MTQRHWTIHPAILRSFVRLAAVLTAVLIVAGCTGPTALTETDNPTRVQVGCESHSQFIEAGQFGQELEGSSKAGLTLFGQVQADKLLVASDTVKKVVWRIGGSGEPIVRLVAPNGDEFGLARGRNIIRQVTMNAPAMNTARF